MGLVGPEACQRPALAGSLCTEPWAEPRPLSIVRSFSRSRFPRPSGSRMIQNGTGSHSPGCGFSSEGAFLVQASLSPANPCSARGQTVSLQRSATCLDSCRQDTSPRADGAAPAQSTGARTVSSCQPRPQGEAGRDDPGGGLLEPSAWAAQGEGNTAPACWGGESSHLFPHGGSPLC